MTRVGFSTEMGFGIGVTRAFARFFGPAHMLWAANTFGAETFGPGATTSQDLLDFLPSGEA
jgi:hypothetical protein